MGYFRIISINYSVSCDFCFWILLSASSMVFIMTEIFIGLVVYLSNIMTYRIFSCKFYMNFLIGGINTVMSRTWQMASIPTPICQMWVYNYIFQFDFSWFTFTPFFFDLDSRTCASLLLLQHPKQPLSLNMYWRHKLL